MYLPILILVITLSSCSSVGHYTPSAEIAAGVANDVVFTNQLKITNDQPSTDTHELHFRGVIVNYNEFTQSLVDSLKAEVTGSKGAISDTAGKELRVSVTRVTMVRGGFNYRARIFAEVRYGADGIEHFNVTRASYGSPFMVSNFPVKPLDAAFRNLVSEIIHNQIIQDYINL
jgi:hypothetical protein